MVAPSGRNPATRRMGPASDTPTSFRMALLAAVFLLICCFTASEGKQRMEYQNNNILNNNYFKFEDETTLFAFSPSQSRPLASLPFPTGAVVFLGPNTALNADNATRSTFPIMAYSTVDNDSLSYQLRFNFQPEITLQNGNVLTIAPGLPVGTYIVDVSS